MTVGLVLAVGQQIIGVNTVVYYSATILQYTGLSASSSVLQAISVGVTNVVFTVVAILLLDRVGRRPLLLTGTRGTIVALVGLGLWFQLPALAGGARPRAGAAAAVHGVVRRRARAGVLADDQRDLPARACAARAMSVATVANWAANFVVSYFFLQLVGVIGTTRDVLAVCRAGRALLGLLLARRTRDQGPVAGRDPAGGRRDDGGVAAGRRRVARPSAGPHRQATRRCCRRRRPRR